jgi:hypothetical protein
LYESKSAKQVLTEANNKKRFKRQTINVLAQGLGLDPADQQLQSLESDFRNVYFGHLNNREIDRVIGYEPLFAKCALDLGVPDNNYDDTEFTKYVNYLILNTKDNDNYTEIINLYKSKINSFEDMKVVVGDDIKASKQADAEQQASMGTTMNPNYTVSALTYEEAHEIGKYSGIGAGRRNGQICYSQHEDTWLSQTYSNNNTNKCFVLLRNDWKYLSGENHDGSERNNGLGELSEYNAYDDYGLSMIMLFINPDGELHECNVRWNHGFNGITKFGPGRSVDHALTEMDIANLMGVPFAKVFNVETFDEKKNKALEKLASGARAVDVFDKVSILKEIRLTAVILGGKFNFLRYIDSKEVMFPDYWFTKIEYLNDQYVMLYINKDNVMFLEIETKNLLTFDEYSNKLLKAVAEGADPSKVFDLTDYLGSVTLVRIGKGGFGDVFCRWNVITTVHGKPLSNNWTNNINTNYRSIGIDSYFLEFDGKYNVFFRYSMLIKNTWEHWATSMPEVCHGKNNVYIRYEVNGNYNAYDPITGQYIVPEGTNPWPPEQDVNYMIWKKWVNE